MRRHALLLITTLLLLTSFVGCDRTRAGYATDTVESQSFEVEGVSFSAVEAEETLDLVNSAERYVLDDELRLDSRAATSIVLARPYDSLDELAERPYVGPATLRILRDSAGQLELES